MIWSLFATIKKPQIKFLSVIMILEVLGSIVGGVYAYRKWKPQQSKSKEEHELQHVVVKPNQPIHQGGKNPPHDSITTPPPLGVAVNAQPQAFGASIGIGPEVI